MDRALGALVVVLGVLIVAVAIPTVGGFRAVTELAEADETQDPVDDQPPATDSTSSIDTAPSKGVEVLSIEPEDATLVPGSEEAVAACAASETERQTPIDSVLEATPAERLALRTDAFQREYHRAVVGTMYCKIFQRPADAEGLQFWSLALSEGMDVYELYLLLAESEEYQLRDVRTQAEVLEALQLSQDLQADAAEEFAAAENPDGGQDQTATSEDPIAAPAERPASTTTLPPIPQTTTTLEEARDLAIELDESNRIEGLRIRTPVAVADFTTFVDSHGLQDVDYVTEALVHGTRHGGSQMVNVAYVHLSRTRGVSVSPGGNGRATVGAWAEDIGAHVAVNGNWYSPWDGPAVSGGVAYAGNDHGYTSLFGFTADGDSIIEHHREINDAVDSRIVEGVAGHPTLIFRGELTTDFGTDPTFLNRNPRTAIGLDASGDVMILVTVDGRRSSAIGMTGAETVQLMAELGAYDAVMLDGGGSSTMWLRDRGVVNRPSGGLRAVANQIAVFGD